MYKYLVEMFGDNRILDLCLPLLSFIDYIKRKASKKEMIPLQVINCMDVENNLPLPTLVEPSDLLDIIHIRKLMIHLLGNAVGHDWYPVYSTFKHGFSLSTMYRNMLEFEGSPVLLVVQDSFGKLFGAMVPSHLRVSDRFYGTGESFLFSFDENNEMQIFHWTGANDYVIKGSIDSIAFGSGDGYFGLWLDQSLYHGSSSTCTTYNNEHLGTKQDFIIHGVEAWGFV